MQGQIDRVFLCPVVPGQGLLVVDIQPFSVLFPVSKTCVEELLVVTNILESVLHQIQGSRVLSYGNLTAEVPAQLCNLGESVFRLESFVSFPPFLAEQISVLSASLTETPRVRFILMVYSHCIMHL